jgi:D-lyxose ketol-isomerase
MFALKPVGQRGALGCGCLWIFTLFWNAIVLQFVGFLFAPGPGGIRIGMGLFLLPFVAIGLFLLGLCVAATYAYIDKKLRYAPPELHVSQQQLRPGDSFSLSVRQGFKRGTDVQGATIRLVLREWARYRRGTDTVTITHDHEIERFDHGARRYEGGQTFADERAFTIPPDAMHSFSASNNKLTWLLLLEIRARGADASEQFELTVLPQTGGGQ